MSKTWDTKKKIIKLLSKEKMTMSEVSETLGLAPSTVSKHIDELREMGAIQMVENPYIKKWKYYTANNEFNPNDAFRGSFVRERIVQIGGVLGVIALIGLLLIFGLPGQAQSRVVNFQLTDPPVVPAGTNALLLTYSSVRVHVVAQNGSQEWISGTGSGTVNLMALINTSQGVGSVSIPANVQINMVSFTVASSRIIINGTSRNVTVPNGVITTNVSTVGGNNGSGVLIDLSPTVVTLFTENSTVFVMVPSVKAVFVGSDRAVSFGNMRRLNKEDKDELESSTPQVVVTSSSVISSGNQTTISVTVKNDGNSSVDIRHIIVGGNFTVVVVPGLNGTIEEPSTAGHININAMPLALGNLTDGQDLGGNSEATTPVTNITLKGHLNSLVSSQNSNAENSNASASAGAGGHIQITSANAFGRITAASGVEIQNEGQGHWSESSTEVNGLVSVGVSLRNFRIVNFFVQSNGALALPFTESDVEGSGYILQAGGSATFTFSGTITLGNGHLIISTVNGSPYNFKVTGDNGAFASANSTSE